MKNHRIYMLVGFAVFVSIGSFLLSGVSVSKAASSDKDVTVINSAANPVPVSTARNHRYYRAVSVSNFPNVLATVPAGTPITLHQTLGLADQ